MGVGPGPDEVLGGGGGVVVGGFYYKIDWGADGEVGV